MYVTKCLHKPVTVIYKPVGVVSSKVNFGGLVYPWDCRRNSGAKHFDLQHFLCVLSKKRTNNNYSND